MVICVLLVFSASTTKPFVFSTSTAPSPETSQKTVDGPNTPRVLWTVRLTLLPLPSRTEWLRESGEKLMMPNASSLGSIVTNAILADGFNSATKKIFKISLLLTSYHVNSSANFYSETLTSNQSVRLCWKEHFNNTTFFEWKSGISARLTALIDRLCKSEQQNHQTPGFRTILLTWFCYTLTTYDFSSWTMKQFRVCRP